MNPKIFVGAAVAIIAIIVGAIAFSGQGFINDVSDGGVIASPDNPPVNILPVTVELDKLEIVSVDEESVTIDIKFKVSNPNQRSVILQFLQYQLFENDLRIHSGLIGDRFEGFVEGSNFYTILSESHTTLPDRIVIQNTGNTPELWNTLLDNNPQWRVTGETFFNLSSMTAGGQNNVTFELEK